MIAAVYARKCTEQNGVADEQKSVTRQVDHAPGMRRSQGLDRGGRVQCTSMTSSAVPSLPTGRDSFG